MTLDRALVLAAWIAAAAVAAADPSLRDPDPDLRRAAFQFLDVERAEALLAGPGGEDRAAARGAAGRLGHDDPVERDRATRLLANLGDAGWEAAGEALASDDPEVARRALEVRARLEKRLGPERHWGGIERVLACRRLASAGRWQALVRAAADADARVRLSAVAGLTHCGIPLPASLQADADPRVRAAAARPAPPALPEPPWVLVRVAEGGEWPGRLQALSPDGDARVDGVPFAAEEVVSIALLAAPRRPGPHRLSLADGTLLTGRFLGLDPARVRFQSAWGPLDLPRAAVRRIVLADDAADAPGSPEGTPGWPCCAGRPEGCGRAHPGRGRLLSADPDGIAFESGRAGPWLSLDFDPPAPAPAPFRLHCAGGDVLAGAPEGARFRTAWFAVEALPDAVLLERGIRGPAARAVVGVGDDAVRVFDARGNELLALQGLLNPHDVDLLADGGVLVADRGNGRVVEFGPDGAERWECDAAVDPVAAQRLPDGNTLITDLAGCKVVEVTPAGAVVWKIERLDMPIEADRLPNGHTLLCEARAHRVVEVDAAGHILWAFDGVMYPADADRLIDGTTLITDRDLGVVLCVAPAGDILWRWLDLSDPFDADPAGNDRFAVAERSRGVVLERRADGKVMRHEAGYEAPLEVEGR